MDNYKAIKRGSQKPPPLPKGNAGLGNQAQVSLSIRKGPATVYIYIYRHHVIWSLLDPGIPKGSAGSRSCQAHCTSVSQSSSFLSRNSRSNSKNSASSVGASYAFGADDAAACKSALSASSFASNSDTSMSPCNSTSSASSFESNSDTSMSPVSNGLSRPSPRGPTA